MVGRMPNLWSCQALPVLALLLVANGVAGAQSATPEQAVRNLIEQLSQGNAEGVVAAFHPAADVRREFEEFDDQVREQVLTMFALIGPQAAALDPDLTFDEPEIEDDLATVDVAVRSPSAKLNLNKTVTLKRGDGGWYLWGNELLPDYLDAAKQAEPEIAEKAADLQEQQASEWRAAVEAEQQKALAEARSEPGRCANAFVDYLAAFDIDMMRELLAPDAEQAKAWARHEREHREIYQEEVRSYAKAIGIVFDGLEISPQVTPLTSEDEADEADEPDEPDEADEIGDKGESRLFEVAFEVPGSDKPAALGRLVVTRMQVAGQKGWYVTESDLFDTAMGAAFAAGGDVAKRLQAHIDTTERRLKAVRKAKSAAKREAREPEDAEEEASDDEKGEEPGSPPAEDDTSDAEDTNGTGKPAAAE
ncbi:MAG: hypothetical protein ACLFTT_01265 [Candidatus Hydrogenedentota bacterium]